MASFGVGLAAGISLDLTTVFVVDVLGGGGTIIVACIGLFTAAGVGLQVVYWKHLLGAGIAVGAFVPLLVFMVWISLLASALRDA
jgi:hypothetical protein